MITRSVLRTEKLSGEGEKRNKEKYQVRVLQILILQVRVLQVLVLQVRAELALFSVEKARVLLLTSFLTTNQSARGNFESYCKFSSIDSIFYATYCQQVGTTEDHLSCIIPQDDVREHSLVARKACELDSGWSWFVCGVCAFCNIIIVGIPYSYGIVFPALLDEFQQGKVNTGAIVNVDFLYASFRAILHQSLPAVPSPPREIVGHFFTLSIPGVGH